MIETISLIVMGSLIVIIKGFLFVLWRLTNARMKEMRQQIEQDQQFFKSYVKTELLKYRETLKETEGKMAGISMMIEKMGALLESRHSKCSEHLGKNVEELWEKVSNLEVESGKLMSILSTTFVFKDTHNKEHENLLQYIQRVEDRFSKILNGVGK